MSKDSVLACKARKDAKELDELRRQFLQDLSPDYIRLTAAEAQLIHQAIGYYFDKMAVKPLSERLSQCAYLDKSFKDDLFFSLSVYDACVKLSERVERALQFFSDDEGFSF